jgi:D-xylose transport system ATP-binding protein
MSTDGAVLALEGVSKSFGPVQALDGVDFSLRSGEVVAIVGDNGAGKSTLVKVRSLNEIEMEQRSHELLGNLAVTITDVRAEVGTMSGGQRQQVAIARSLLGEPKVVILDEPTAALGVRQTAQVLQLIKRLRERGEAVVVISHNLADVFEVADRIFVLRLGKQAGDFDAARVSQEDVVAAITGATAGRENGGER